MHKIQRNIEKYGLDDLRDSLRRRRADGESLRDLERFVNVRVLEAALRAGGGDVVGDPASIYEALRGDETSVGRRTEVERRLSSGGVPVEEIERDFVSYEAVRTYLRDRLDVDTGRESGVTLEEGRGIVEWARARCRAVIERTLSRLDDAGELDAAAVTVSTTVRVTCEESGETYRLSEFIDRGGCPDDP